MFIQPLFTLSYAITGCAYEIFVNGVLVASDLTATPTTRQTEYINHLLINGRNRIDIRSYVDPQEDISPFDLLQPNAHFSIELLSREAGQGLDANVVLASIGFSLESTGGAARPDTSSSSLEGRFLSGESYTPHDRGDVSVGAVEVSALPGGIGFQVTRSVTLPLPERRSWSFDAGESMPQLWEGDLATFGPLYDELLDAYQKIWQALHDRSLSNALAFFEERSRETDQAYYYQPGTTQKKLERSLVRLFSDDKMVLSPPRPPEGFWPLIVGTTGKVVQLSRSARGSSILWWESTEDDVITESIPVSFYRRGGRFLVAR